MPLHFNSITGGSQTPRLLAWILTEALGRCDKLLISADKRFLHVRADIPDDLTGDVIGGFVFTLDVKEDEEHVLIKDIDIVFDPVGPTVLEFLELRPESSDANEYYDVLVPEGGQRLQIETVNRHAIAGLLAGTERKVRISAFPFRLSLHSSMKALNRSLGLDRKITVKGTDLVIGGLSETFAAPGGMLVDDEEEAETYSVIIGTVVSVREVQITLGEVSLPFLLVQLDTALGVIPVAMSREVFDIEGIGPGMVVYMSADVKADLSEEAGN